MTAAGGGGSLESGVWEYAVETSTEASNLLREKSTENDLIWGMSISRRVEVLTDVISEVPSVPVLWLIDAAYTLGCKSQATYVSLRKKSIRGGLRPGPNVCELCENSWDKLYLDHCHLTHRVRGYLCGPCNRCVSALTAPEWVLRAGLSNVKYPRPERSDSKLLIESAEKVYSYLENIYPGMPSLDYYSL